MRIFSVGGSVRDEILGLEPHDEDFVVVGSTHEEMIALDFVPVGADFPVYLKEGREYALARREYSTGPGYNDFAVEFDPSVTLEEDLGRRDFRMNAIAKDLETGEYIDYHGGIEDIKNRVIDIMYNDVFKDDPVRILRMARLSAKFPAFHLSDRAIAMAELGDISHATPERVGQELTKALMTPRPSLFFYTLLILGQLKHWFPEIHALHGVPQPIKHHMEGDALAHTMMVLDEAAKEDEDVFCRFGALVHDLGKGNTPEDVLPKHIGHEHRGINLVEEMCDRLKLSNKFERVGKYAAKYHTHVHNVDKLNAKTFVKVFNDIKHHYDELIYYISTVAYYDNEGKLPYTPYNNKDYDFTFLTSGANVKLSDGFTIEEIEKMSIDKRKQELYKLQLNGVKKRMMNEQPEAGEIPA